MLDGAYGAVELSDDAEGPKDDQPPLPTLLMQIMQGKAQEAVDSAFMVYKLTAEPTLPSGEVTCKGSTSEEHCAKSDNEDGDSPSGTSSSGVGGCGSDAVEEQEGLSDDDPDALMLQEGSQQG